MPTIKINNEELTYDNIIYVDAVNGDDTNGDGSEGNPYQTLNVAYNNLSGSDVAIKLTGGVYNIDPYIGDYNGNNLSIIGSNENTILKVTSWPINAVTAMTGSANINFYDLIWDGNDITGVIVVKIRTIWEFHNTTFVNTYSPDANAYFSPRPDSNVENSAELHMFNCTKPYNVNETATFKTQYGPVKLKNCYGHFVQGKSTSQVDWDIDSNIITSETNLDPDYNITAGDWQNQGTGLNPDGTQANIGVYGGPYAWGEWPIPELVNLLFDPLYPFVGEDTSINISGIIREIYDKNIDLRYRLTLNGNQLYPESPYPYSTTEESTEDYMSTATGYETQEGTISISSRYEGSTNSNYHGWYAFNDTNNGDGDCWLTADGDTNGWIEIHLNEPVIFKKYTLTSRDASIIPRAEPKDWTFEGSNDGVNWDVLDTITGEINWTANEKREFEFTNHGLYNFYRLNITDNNGKDYIAVGEIEFFGPGDIAGGFSEKYTTPFNLNTNLNTNRFNVGDNTLTLEVLDNNDTKMEILDKTITKYDRDTFTMTRNLNNDGSINVSGDSIIDSNGLSLSTTGKGSAVIEIPTEGKARLLENSFSSSLKMVSDTNVIPTMTSNTSPSGKASASNSWTSTEPWNAFDGIKGYNQTGNYDAWGTANTSGWLAYEFPEKKIINRYSIAVNDYPPCFPSEWTFEGSNDGVGWDTLDTRVVYDWVDNEERDFFFENTTQYKHYRINVFSNNGSTSGTVNLVITEMEMFENYTLNKQIEPKTKTEDMTNQGSSGEGTVYEKEINTDLDITSLNVKIKSS